jgi:sec-independent protein translocase protein TatA
MEARMFTGHWEILLILFAILLLFGARKLPELAQGMGKGIREFRKAVKESPNDKNEPEKIENQNEEPEKK